jgi:hypothetical protein
MRFVPSHLEVTRPSKELRIKHHISQGFWNNIKLLLFKSYVNVMFYAKFFERMSDFQMGRKELHG